MTFAMPGKEVARETHGELSDNDSSGSIEGAETGARLRYFLRPAVRQEVILGAVITGKVRASLTVLLTYWMLSPSNTVTTSGSKATTISMKHPLDGAGVPQHVIGVTGEVHNLKLGENVWIVVAQTAPPKNDFAAVGPCAITGTTWTCDYVNVGLHGYDTASYKVWALVVTSQQSAILGHLASSKMNELIPPAISPEQNVANYPVVVHRCGTVVATC